MIKLLFRHVWVVLTSYVVFSPSTFFGEMIGGEGEGTFVRAYTYAQFIE